MKKIGLALLFAAPFWCLAQNTFKITGSVRGVNPSVEKVYISYASGGHNVLDSALVRSNRYRFEGFINEPTRIDLRAAYKAKGASRPSMARDLITLFADATEIEVNSTDSFSNAVISGSASNVEFRKLQDAAKPFEKEVAELLQQAEQYKKEKNEPAIEQIEVKLDKIQAEIKEKVYAQYIRKYPNAALAFFALQQYSGALMAHPAKVEQLFNLLPQKVQQSPDGKRMRTLIGFAKLADVGDVAPNFTQSNPEGEAISLTDFKGKYVLLNFWASWCGPCRAQNPHFVKLYKQYKNEGLEIISVSLDKPGEKQAWKEAIANDHLTWAQVSDLRFWNNAVARQYGVVAALPQNFLIAPDGKIIAKNLRPDQLARKLKILFQ